jgi:hypothetical protein
MKNTHKKKKKKKKKKKNEMHRALLVVGYYTEFKKASVETHTHTKKGVTVGTQTRTTTCYRDIISGLQDVDPCRIHRGHLGGRFA